MSGAYLHAAVEMKPTYFYSVDLSLQLGRPSAAMITDEGIDDLDQQILQLRKELDEFKDVVANAVSKLNARINALEQRLPAPRSRRGRGSRSSAYMRPVD